MSHRSVFDATRSSGLLRAAMVALIGISAGGSAAQTPQARDDAPDTSIEAEQEPFSEEFSSDEVDYEGESGYEYVAEVVIRDAHREVLARKEFERLQDEPDEESSSGWQWLDDFLDWLGELFELDGGQEASTGMTLPGLGSLLYLAAGLAVLAVLIAVVYWILERSTKASDELTDSVDDGTSLLTPPGHLAPGDYLNRAGELAAKANYRLAVRELLLGSMSYLERTGAIRYRRGLTNRDYYRSAKGRRRDGIRVIIGHFERIFYGRRTATREHYVECAERFRDGFVEIPESG